MSAFTDSMIEAGFDNPSDYLDYLCSQDDLREMMLKDQKYCRAFYNLPKFIRKLYEPTCPNCGNELEILVEGYNCFVKCVGFPACRFERAISWGEDFISSSQSFRETNEWWEQLRQELVEIQECPLCKNKLKRIKLNDFDYIKCYGFPECKYSKKLISKKPKM